ncbi:MAG: flagellar hook-associated protein FlgL [Deltaproteobacteria bacterium]|nr:flagellar hook-associated protein FlgL [Deltaproteobacteria bacterium]
MLRVTNSMVNLQAQRELAKARARLEERQRVASSGQRVGQAADDPAAAGELVRLQGEAQANTQFQRNIDHAMAELDTADSALGNVTEVLHRARELAVQMANGTISAADRAVAAREMQGLRDQVVALANTRVGEVYIFGGHRTGQPPFAASGTYAGDTGQRSVEVEGGVVMNAGVSGAQAFTAAGGQDVLGVLASLSTALTANDVDGIRTSLTSLESAANQVGSAHVSIGQQVGALSQQRSFLTDRHLDIAQHRSRVGDAEVTEALSGLVRAQTSLNAALEVSAKVLNSLSLVDRL